MRTLSLLIVIFASSLSMAQIPSNECTKKLLQLNDWSELSETVLLCLDSSDVFSNAIKELCRDDRRQLSTEYQQYLKYKKEYEDTLFWYQSLPLREQQTSAARYKLRFAKENWENLGLKHSIRSMINKFDESYRSCNPNFL
jgi:hypothetical protein